MNGKEAISEIVVSLATGRFISVVEVSIMSETGKAIGLIQRDYELSQLQRFVHTLATENTRVWILDRDGRMIAHSSHTIEKEEDRIDANHYDFVGRALPFNQVHTFSKKFTAAHLWLVCAVWR